MFLVRTVWSWSRSAVLVLGPVKVFTWKPVSKTVAKMCSSELIVGKLNIYIKPRKENVALYNFTLKMSPWVRSLSDLKLCKDLEEFQIKWKGKQSSDSWDHSTTFWRVSVRVCFVSKENIGAYSGQGSL